MSIIPTLIMAAQLVVPSQRQLAWHDMEYYGFVHFGPNTFTAKEWGSGLEDPNIFNPKELDTRQWAKTFKDAGMKGVIITAKHHDGFCLWPSKYSTHTVAQSPFKRDILKELAASCKEFGIKLGVYLSPWDRNHPTYGTQEYNEVFKNMLREVLTNYGPIFEVWFDGANGEGPNGKKQIYDWPGFIGVVRELQPNAVIFSDAGPDVRWVGNEAGHSDPTCWSTLNRDLFVPGSPLYAQLTKGHEGGSHWVPAECDVSIRPGWFWRATENDKVKSPETLLDLYLRSVGQNGSFLLNVPPDTRGFIHENDVKSLLEFKQLRDELFSQPTTIKGMTASSGDPTGLNDTTRNTFWAPSPRAATHWVRFDVNRGTQVRTVVLQEAIQFGQTVTSFEVNSGVEIAKGTTIGAKRIFHLKSPVTVDQLELRIKSSRGPVKLASVQFYR